MILHLVHVLEAIKVFSFHFFFSFLFFFFFVFFFVKERKEVSTSKVGWGSRIRVN